MSKKIVIAGASGFIGTSLVSQLLNHSYDVVILSRDPQKVTHDFQGAVRIAHWVPDEVTTYENEIDGAWAVINLAGENISKFPWTSSLKKRIIESRVKAASGIKKAIANARNKPEILIQASATGYYGNTAGIDVTEEAPAGTGFLAEVCHSWEQASLLLDKKTRHITIRIGIVLGSDGGFLARIIPPFKMYAGGHLGNGENYLPWIHIDDLVRAVVFLLQKKAATGVFNLSAPAPVKSKQFFESLGRALNRPSWLHLPGFLMKAMLGEMADEMILAGQKALPANLEKQGFEFKFTNIDDALFDLLP